MRFFFLKKKKLLTWHSTWYHVDEFSCGSFAVNFVSRKWNFNLDSIISIAIQKKLFSGGEFRPYNKIKPLTIGDRTAKSNEKRVGEELENVVPTYLAYPPPFSSNVRPSTSQLGPNEPGLHSGKLSIEDIIQLFGKLTG